MIKKIFFVLFLILVIPETVLAGTHGIYSDPILPEKYKKYDTFMIDFKGVKTPCYTYWALFNFGLYITNFEADGNHYNVTGGGAYAGLQNTDNKRVGIMSFWQIEYTETPLKVNKKILRSKCLYPTKENEFGGEGERSKLYRTI